MLLGIATIGSLLAMEKDETPTGITSPNYNFIAPKWTDSENQHHLFKNVVLTRKYISDNSKPGIDNEPEIDLETLNTYHYHQGDYFENVINGSMLLMSGIDISDLLNIDLPNIMSRVMSLLTNPVACELKVHQSRLSRSSAQLHEKLLNYMAYGSDVNQEPTLAQSFYSARGEFNKVCFDILEKTKNFNIHDVLNAATKADFLSQILGNLVENSDKGSDDAESGDYLGGNSTQHNLNFIDNFVINAEQEIIEQQRRASEQKKRDEEENRKRQEQYEQYQYDLIDDFIAFSNYKSDSEILETVKEIDLAYLRHALKSPYISLAELTQNLVHNECIDTINYLNTKCFANIQLPQKQKTFQFNFNYS